MNSQDSYQNFYDPKTLAMMDRAFAAIWTAVKADDPFRNYAHDRELRTRHWGKASELGGGWNHRSHSAATAHRRELVSSVLIDARQPAQPLPFTGLVNAIQGLQNFLGDHPVLTRRTKFAAWFVAVTAISFCWFIR